MNAKQAREKAASKNTSAAGGQYNEIILLISKAVNKGEYEMWYYSPIKDDVRIKLRADCYKVGATQFDRNETLTKISW